MKNFFNAENLAIEDLSAENSGAVKQLQRNFKYLLSRFSHEIRNPLTLVISELQLMSSNHPEIAHYKEWDDIIESLEYTKDLLNEMSSYNNADHLSPKDTDLTEFLNTVIASVRPSMNYLNITFETEIPEDLPRRSVDCLKLRQALLNLLRNAQEAVSNSNGKIIFRACSESEERICLMIHDNGTGIDPAFFPDLFVPFATTKPAGTGLGLPITKQIIDAHHGRIHVDSSPTEGTVFQILL